MENKAVIRVYDKVEGVIMERLITVHTMDEESCLNYKGMREMLYWIGHDISMIMWLHDIGVNDIEWGFTFVTPTFTEEEMFNNCPTIDDMFPVYVLKALRMAWNKTINESN